MPRVHPPTPVLFRPVPASNGAMACLPVQVKPGYVVGLGYGAIGTGAPTNALQFVFLQVRVRQWWARPVGIYLQAGVIRTRTPFLCRPSLLPAL